MKNSGLSTAERDEMRACRDQIEQYVKIAESETTKDEEMVSLANKMADVFEQGENIADRVQGRLASPS